MGRTDLHDDEFDIEVLAQKTARVFGRAASWVLRPVRVITARPMRLGAFLMAGVIVAIVFRYTLPSTWKSNFILKPLNRGDLYFANLVNDLSDLVDDHAYTQLAAELRLDEELCRKVRRLDLDVIRNGKFKDTVEIAIIYLTTTDRNSFDTLQRSIHSYLENSEYYDKMRKLKLADIGELREKLSKDLGEMDRLKETVSRSMQPRDAGGYVFGEPVNPVDVYEEELKLYRQQMSLKWQEQYSNSFELVKKCVVSERPYFPRLGVLLSLTLPLSLVFCYFYNIFRKDSPGS